LHADEAKRRWLTPLATRTVFAASCVVAIVLFVGARPLIVYLFGAVYEEAVGALRWLLPGVLILAVAYGVGNDLAARGRVDINLGVAAAVVAVNIVLNLALIPRYGVDGAAMAATFSYGLNLIIGLVIYRRITGNRWYTLMVFQRRDFEILREKLESLKGTR
jgi:O-antigen/teichoic acid export membrane protein